MIIRITRIGGSRAIIIPDDICRLLGIDDDSELDFDLNSDLLGRVMTLRLIGKYKVKE